ncbi:RNA polymerase sigma-70 factor, ECF subfamily [Pseudomonas citronellolis]|uniref:RNA polymerase sigma-70 factor, ECF subfamily n=1 Tax=Pseudomonas citronellolis TaxID=53408 RepID=A0AAQ1HKQ8_9PSED|nr:MULTISPECIES: sigma-70 family RNA polymerase sigma factor [Pseudomonas]MCL6687439.1 sigma-70 family RNA polymerase sigma factor [Pseudomonas sp. R3.Fl]KES22284.1 RNA polymerase subunit sigma-24 [Pseudomonas sp. AAC]MBH3432163.1 sigma-70 family RNA polymerase sigma factor [Pseudomonas citronellolis]MCP1603447.1 RNA polymerase sigma-70 factor (ECF subfamily) [Pseudomonas citronellolis]MCP1654558.1 RNA polymerase sigma-70 factor (ECF subfamily) [Pseudomonas citronellolis]
MSLSHLDTVFLAQRTPLLRTLARMVKNPSIAEELVQETYLRVARTLRERPVEHLEPFLFQTGRNLALDHLRHLRMQSRTLLDDVPQEVLQAVPSSQSSAEDGLHAEQLLERLGSALERLTPRQQRIFILSRLHGCGYAEIAEQLGVSPSTVQKELKLIMAICIGVLGRLEPPA